MWSPGPVRLKGPHARGNTKRRPASGRMSSSDSRHSFLSLPRWQTATSCSWRPKPHCDRRSPKGGAQRGSSSWRRSCGPSTEMLGSFPGESPESGARQPPLLADHAHHQRDRAPVPTAPAAPRAGEGGGHRSRPGPRAASPGRINVPAFRAFPRRGRRGHHRHPEPPALPQPDSLPSCLLRAAGDRCRPALADLADRWNPLFEPGQKQDLVDDVNALVRDLCVRYDAPFSAVPSTSRGFVSLRGRSRRTGTSRRSGIGTR